MRRPITRCSERLTAMRARVRALFSVNSLVPRHVTRPRETFLTKSTLEWFFLCMYSFMLNHGMLAPEFQGTEPAVKRSVVGVDAFVIGAVPRLRESRITVSALVRTKFGVGAFMSGQASRLAESLITVFTLEGFLFGVDTFMLSQCALTTETLLAIAARVGASVQHRFGVQLFVLDQSSFVGEACIALLTLVCLSMR